MTYKARRCPKCRELINGNDIAFNLHFRWCGHNTGLNYISEKDLVELERKLGSPSQYSTSKPRNSIDAEWNRINNWSGKQ